MAPAAAPTPSTRSGRSPVRPAGALQQGRHRGERGKKKGRGRRCPLLLLRGRLIPEPPQPLFSPPPKERQKQRQVLPQQPRLLPLS